MKLYLVQYDGTSWYIEAASFGDALVAWRNHVAVEWGDDYADGDEPESVALVHDRPVVR